MPVRIETPEKLGPRASVIPHVSKISSTSDIHPENWSGPDVRRIRGGFLVFFGDETFHFAQVVGLNAKLVLRAIPGRALRFEDVRVADEAWRRASAVTKSR